MLEPPWVSDQWTYLWHCTIPGTSLISNQLTIKFENLQGTIQWLWVQFWFNKISSLWKKLLMATLEFRSTNIQSPPPLPKKTHTFCMLNSSKVSFQMVSEKKIESEMFTDNDDGHKMMTIVHMTLRSGNLKMNFLLLINTS